jgi:hypothetical protein
LTDGFSDQKLRDFCFDTPDFRPVHDELATNTGKAEIVARLLEYADQQCLLGLLLAWAREQNPTRYELHQPYHYEFTTSIPYQTRYSSSIKRFLEQYLDSDQGRVPFGGRESDLAKLDNWLADLQAPPYLFLTAPLGRGKSALLCRWFHSLQKRDGIHVIFVPISIRAETNSFEVVYNELGVRLARFHSDPEQRVDWSPELVSNYLRRPVPEGQQLLVILDGVDEAEGWKVKASLFPGFAPKGLRVVVSARPLADDKNERDWLYRLGWEAPGRALTLHLDLLSPQGIKDMLDAMGSPLNQLASRTDIVDRLHYLSEGGDPFLVHEYVKEFSRSDQEVAGLKLEDLNKMEPGLEFFIEHCGWDKQGQSGLKNEATRDLLGVLTLALRPMQRKDIDELVLEGPLADPGIFKDAISSLNLMLTDFVAKMDSPA